ncbi:EGF-like repeat and discoidin I-like domain-containing protein 3 isoform X1 [Pygocentrus nattereri]|uniref:EGF like repeats and discoidin domains 3 n=1 Tax=Pygocentrus nattereri TaxID=42514 RepID=A0A3B4BV69_PYGNA|nr:EGF-like repeat and discoidin I-like domain-containing protein 3 isoform X1 [Pygocentrus nattereri]
MKTVIMLSKHSSRSSLRASLNSLKFLFESPLEKSVRSTGGDSSSTQFLLSPERRRVDTLSADARTDDGTETKEDILEFESEDSVSVNESKDAISIDETKDSVSKGSSFPDTFEGKPAKDCISEADTVSVAGTCESKHEDGIISPLETKDFCLCGCSGPLGMEGGIISNQQITGSSTHRALFGLQKWYPYFARLNKKGLVNAWTAAENDRWPWLQINLQRRMRVTGLITQGAKHIGSPEYVKSYKVAYSDDGKTWSMHKVKDTDEDMIFTGNSDNNTPYANSFSPPIEAQYICIYPQVCRKHCTLRMELLGCELTGCSEPMGMKTGHIQDYQISSSSVFQTLNMGMFLWKPSKARLDKQGKVNAWTSAHNDQSQWLQVDLLLPTKVTGIITQGAKDFGHVQFVGSYKLAYSNDGEKWHIYQDEKQKKDKIFQGNFDNETHRKNVIDPPIYARFVRIVPWSWYGRITMRAELLGCREEE